MSAMIATVSIGLAVVRIALSMRSGANVAGLATIHTRMLTLDLGRSKSEGMAEFHRTLSLHPRCCVKHTCLQLDSLPKGGLRWR